MLSASFARWLSIVLSLAPVTLSAPTASSTEAELALNYLQSKWYNRTSGLWDSTGWWNSGNCLTAIGDLAAIDSTVTGTAQDVFANTLVQAQKYNLQQLKVITPQFNMETFQGPNFPDTVQAAAVVNPKGFLNGYYDDEGWWALGWIQAYDVTKNQQYLQTAVNIFNDMHASPTTPCGGIWWDKAHTYVNAIANELYLSVGAHLANRVASNKTFYLTTAQNQYNWFIKSGMINSKNTINDGLTTACANNKGTVWSYNQGVILGALTELSTATGNSSYRTLATNIANAAITALSDSNGILHDPCEPNCGADGAQFKGIFMRNLQILQKAAPNQAWVKFLVANGASIWAYDRDTSTNALSVVWSGPFVKPANASTQSSALDALIAAQAVGGGSYQKLAIASRGKAVLKA